MAFPAEQVADRAFSESGSSTSHSIDLPANLASGDMVIIVAGQNDLGGSWGVPAGWTKEVDSPQLGVFSRVADGTEGASITVTTDSSVNVVAIATRITGHNSNVEVATDLSDTNDANPDPPNLIPSWGAKDTLWIAGFAARVVDRFVNSYPSGYGDGANNLDGNGGNTQASLATRDLNASSEDPGQFTLDDNTPWKTFTIAVEPAPSGPTAATLAERAGTDDENVALDVTSADTGASEHELYRSTSTMSGDPEANGSLIQDGISAASASFNLTDNESESTTGPTPDTTYFYQVLTRDGSGGTALSNEISVTTAPARPTAIKAAPRNLVVQQGADPRMDTDSGDGVVSGFSTITSADNIVFSVDQDAQKIEVSSQTGGSEAAVLVKGIPVTVGKPYRMEVECRVASLSSAEILGTLLLIYYDADGFVTDLFIEDFTGTSFTRRDLAATAPPDTATLGARVELRTTGDASNDSGSVWFRDLQVWLDDGSEIEDTAFTIIGMDETSGEHKVHLYIREKGTTSWHIDRTLDMAAGEDFQHTFEDLTPGTTYEVAASSVTDSGLESGLTTPIEVALSGKPDTPTLTVDQAGETTADLSSSAFSDPQGDAHAASEWEVDESGGGFSTPVFDSGEDTSNLTSITATGLTAGNPYIARVRHKDDQGNWSDWSATVSFSTTSNRAPDKPSLTVDEVLATQATLSGSGYTDPEGDPHDASQWQVDTSGGDFSTPVFDSGTDQTNLTSIDATGLTAGVTYKARVRYRDDQLNWSPYSDAETFTTQSVGATVRSGTRTRPADVLLGMDFERGREGAYGVEPTYTRGSVQWVRSQRASGAPLYVPARGDQVAYSRVEVEGVLAPTRALDLTPGVTPTNDDSVSFLPSDSTWGLTQGSESDMTAGVDSVFEGREALRWDPTAQGDRINDTGIADGDGGRQTVQAVVGFKGLPAGREIRVRLKDDTAATAIATCVLDADDGSVSGTGDVYGRRLAHRGRHGDEVWLLTATGLTTDGNAQSMWLEPAHVGSGGSVYLYQAIHHTFAHPVPPLAYTGAPVSGASTDVTVPSIRPQSHVNYTRFVSGTHVEGETRMVWSNGSTTNQMELREDGNNAGFYEVVVRDADGTLAAPGSNLSPALGQLVELAVVYDHGSGETRIVGRVDGGSASASSITPASWTSPNAWAEDRRYGARPDGTRPIRAWLLRDVAVTRSSLEAPTDGTDDDALLDEMERVLVPDYGVAE